MAMTPGERRAGVMHEIVTRFAPSPTGALHLGHAFAAMTAHDLARRAAGRFLLRIEDIDGARCRPDFEQAILEDLAWLGLQYDGPLLRQSQRLDAYAQALLLLRQQGLVYPCFCTRGDIAAEIARMGAAPQGPAGSPYPGICRKLEPAQAEARMARGDGFAWRLNVAAALASLGTGSLVFDEEGRGPSGETGRIRAEPALCGDVVLGRKDLGVSYHLAAVLDDAFQGVTLVTRGEDLFVATHVQRLLQALLGLPVPRYHHHRLVCDPSGRRLAKRDRDLALAVLRAGGASPREIRRRLGLDLGEGAVRGGRGR